MDDISLVVTSSDSEVESENATSSSLTRNIAAAPLGKSELIAPPVSQSVSTIYEKIDIISTQSTTTGSSDNTTIIDTLSHAGSAEKSGQSDCTIASTTTNTTTITSFPEGITLTANTSISESNSVVLSSNGTAKELSTTGRSENAVANINTTSTGHSQATIVAAASYIGDPVEASTSSVSEPNDGIDIATINASTSFQSANCSKDITPTTTSTTSAKNDKTEQSTVDVETIHIELNAGLITSGSVESIDSMTVTNNFVSSSNLITPVAPLTNISTPVRSTTTTSTLTPNTTKQSVSSKTPSINNFATTAALPAINNFTPTRPPKKHTPRSAPVRSSMLTPTMPSERRSSSRSIKRKRFDDEIVEYSVNTQHIRSGESNRPGRPRTTSHTYVPQTLQPVPSLPILTTPTIVTNLTTQLLPPPPLPAHSPIKSVEIDSMAKPIKMEMSPPKIKPRHMSPPTTSKAAQQLNVQHSTPLITQQPTQLNIVSPADAPRQVSRSTFRHTTDRRRGVRSGRQRSRRGTRIQNQNATKDLGRWKPVDDLALAINVIQTNDLRVVHRCVKFSCRFTLQEIQARWSSLLYEPAISRIAVAAIRNLHPEIVKSVRKKALFSEKEEEVLSTFKSTDNPKLEQFQDLLEQNITSFYFSRTAKSLMKHWQLLKQYMLLPDQVIKRFNPDDLMSFSDYEDQMCDGELNEPCDENLEAELAMVNRKQQREMRIIENELHRLSILVDSVNGTPLSQEFDGQTLAVLRGRLVRYLMRSKEITLGRDAKEYGVDIDLSLEGPSAKISRRQGTIKLRSNGDFFIANEGKRAIFVNGMPILTGSKGRLANNYVVEMCGLRFIFLVNYELINAIRHESAKTTTPLN